MGLNISGNPALYTGSSGTPPVVGTYQGQVAIGDGASVTSTGAGNLAIGTGAKVGGTGSNSVALGTSYAAASNTFSAGIGTSSVSYGAQVSNSGALGLQNLTSATGSWVMGANSISYAQYSIVLGYQSYGYNYGQLTHSSGNISVAGDAQTSEYILRATTSAATGVVAYLDGASQQIGIRNNQAVAFEILAVAHDVTTPANNAVLSTLLPGLVINNAGTLSVASPTFQTTVSTNSWATSGMSILVAPSGTNITILVSAPTGNTDTIHWVVRVKTVEVMN